MLAGQVNVAASLSCWFGVCVVWKQEGMLFLIGVGGDNLLNVFAFNLSFTCS